MLALRVRAASGILLSLLWLLPGCGKRGDPLPPLRPVPAPAEAVAIHQTGKSLVLEWRAPSRNRDGTTENVDLREVRILRRVLDLEALVEAQTQSLEPPDEEPEAERAVPDEPPGDDEAPLADPAETVPVRPALQIPPFSAAEAEGIETLPSTELGAALAYEEEVAPDWIGKRVEYALIYTNGSKRASPLSSVAQIEPAEELPVPGAPVASVGDGMVELHWEAGGSSDDGFFSVYRRAGEAESYPRAPVNPAPVDSPELTDEGIVFGRPVCYAVRRVSPPRTPTEEAPERAEAELEVEGGAMPTELVPVVPSIADPPRIESLLSEETCLTPEDTFAPEPPNGLAGVSTERGILLTWDVVQADDLGGYRVYRSASPDGLFELLNDAIVTEASYVDETAEPASTYYYAVTAVDSTDRVNESRRSELAEARRLSP